jgi:hypothetical protein
MLKSCIYQIWVIIVISVLSTSNAAEILYTGSHPGAVKVAELARQRLAAKEITIELELDPSLEKAEYILTKNGNSAVCRGGAPRALLLGCLKLADTNVDGVYGEKLKWKRLYYSDQRGFMMKPDDLLFLAEQGIYGFVWHFSWHDWKDFKKETRLFPNGPTIGEWLRTIQEFTKLELLDYLLTIHICNTNTKPPLDLSSDAQIDEFIGVLRLAASSGIRHIMICADDHTKFRDDRYVCTYPSEVERFGDSVGRAHGYLCRRAYEALHGEFPSLELSFVPAPYSLLDHKSENAGNRKYLADWSQLAPQEVMLVWTGPRIIPDIPMTREHFLRYKAMVPGHKVGYWDNSECTDHPWPRWMARLYPEAAEDHGGFMMVNAHAFCWPDTRPFLLSCIDYVQRSAPDADLVELFTRNAEKLYGTENAKLLTEVTRLVSEYNSLSSWVITKQPAIIARLNELNLKLGKRSITTTRLAGWLKRMNDQISTPRKEYVIPRFEGDAFSDAHGIGADFKGKAIAVPLGKGTHGKEMGTFYLAHDKDALLIAFDGPVLEKLTPEKAMGEKMGICYDFIHLGVADAAAGPFTHSRNAVMEWQGEEWHAKSYKYGDNYQLMFEIPYTTLQAKGMTDFQTSGKLSLYAARVTYTVNHFGLSPKSVPANATLLK